MPDTGIEGTAGADYRVKCDQQLGTRVGCQEIIQEDSTVRAVRNTFEEMRVPEQTWKRSPSVLIPSIPRRGEHSRPALRRRWQHGQRHDQEQDSHNGDGREPSTPGPAGGFEIYK